MNGWMPPKLFRREGGTLPIIMQTAHAFSTDREMLIKPVLRRVLVETDYIEHLAQLPEQLPSRLEMVGFPE